MARSASTSPPLTFVLAAALALAALAGRVVLSAWVGVAPDEAYYLLWSRHLAAGYLDHPPAVAWLIASATALLGDGPVGLRLPALVGAGVALPALLYWLGREAGLEGRGAALLPLSTVLMPLGLAAGLIITPDVPLILAWTACAAASLRALRLASLSWWLVAGLALGGALLSKHSAWILLGSVGLGLLLGESGRLELRRPGPWLGLLLALSIASPNLAWDLARGFPSLGYQLGHGLGARALLAAPIRLLELLGGQIGLLTPLVAWGIVWAARRDIPVAREGRRFLWVLGLTPLLVFAAASLLAHPEANWPAPAHPLLLTATLAHLSETLRGVPEATALRLRRFVVAAICTSAALSTAALIHLLHPLPGFPPGREPAARLRAWGDLPPWLVGPEVEVARAGDYELAAALGYHLPGRPTIPVGCDGECQADALALVASPGTTPPEAPRWMRRRGSCLVEAGRHPMRRADGAVVRTLTAFRFADCPDH